MKILKNVLLGLGGFIMALVLVAYLLPRHAYVARSRDMAASTSAIQANILDMRRWAAWEPWGRYDTTMTIVYAPNTVGPGAWYSWQSGKMGKGKISLLTACADSVTFLVDFGTANPAHAQYHFAPVEGGKTRVTWAFVSDAGNNPIGRWMNLFMDKFVGPDFEYGLTRMATISEKS